MKKGLFICAILMSAMFLSCGSGSDEKDYLDYLLVKFKGDEKWSLLNAKGEVLQRDKLASSREPSMVSSGIFVADGGYYNVDDIATPIFDSKYICGTQFVNGQAVAVVEDESGNKFFELIDTKGEEIDLLSGEREITLYRHGYYSTYNDEGKRKICLIGNHMTGMSARGNVVLGPNRTGALFFGKDARGFTDRDNKTYRAYDNTDVEMWSTKDNLLNFNDCHKMGYLVKRTDDGHLVILDLDLKEIFSHPDAYVRSRIYGSDGYTDDIFFDDKVVYCPDAHAYKFGLMKIDGTVLFEPQFSKLVYLGDGIYLADYAGDGESEGIGYLINEKGEKIIEDKIDVLSTQAQVLRSLKPRLGKYFILYNENHEVIFVDGKGSRLELPAELSYAGCLGNNVCSVAESDGRSRNRFKIRD